MVLSILGLLRQNGALPLASRWQPTITIADMGGSYQVRGQLTGIDPKSVQVQVTESAVSVAGSGKVEQRLEGRDYAALSSSTGSFFQTVPLPAQVNPHASTMWWESDATLVIDIPKTL